MITLLNRKELFITYSLEEQIRIRNILLDNNVECLVKCSGINNHALGRGFYIGINHSCSYKYKIYVKRKDFEKALHHIHSKR